MAGSTPRRPDDRRSGRRVALSIALGLMAAVTVALTVAVIVRPGPLSGELGYLRWLQRLPEPVPTIAEVVRVVTSTEAALVVAVVAVLVAMLIRHRPGRAAVAAAIAALTMLVVQPVMKEVVDRPRPSPELVDVRAEPTSMSFPSGHSMSTTTVWGAAAGIAWLRGRRRVAAAACAPVVLTFLSGGVQGVHWPSDAVGGTMLGAIAAAAIVGVVLGGDDRRAARLARGREVLDRLTE